MSENSSKPSFINIASFAVALAFAAGLLWFGYGQVKVFNLTQENGFLGWNGATSLMTLWAAANLVLVVVLLFIHLMELRGQFSLDYCLNYLLFGLVQVLFSLLLWFVGLQKGYVWTWGETPVFLFQLLLFSIILAAGLILFGLNTDRFSLDKLLNYVIFGQILIIIFLGIWHGMDKVDYIWRWHSVPQYFMFKTDPGEGVVINFGLFKWDWGYAMGPLLLGLWMTLKISFISVICAIVIGLIAGLARISDHPALRWYATIYVELIRGTPLLVQIFIFYFFVGTVLHLSRFAAGTAALAVFAGAYVAEIVRAGIQSIARGQMEAARSLGMTYFQAMRYIILPQAFRRILPPLAGQFISLIKDSSLVSVIALSDLTKMGREVITSTFSTFEIWLTVAALYLVLTFTLSMLIGYLERRFHVAER